MTPASWRFRPPQQHPSDRLKVHGRVRSMDWRPGMLWRLWRHCADKFPERGPGVPNKPPGDIAMPPGRDRSP